MKKRTKPTKSAKQSAQNVVALSEYRKAAAAPPMVPTSRPAELIAIPSEPLDPQWWHIPLAAWCINVAMSTPTATLVSSRELQFLYSMREWWDLPSERQSVWLEAIERRLEQALRDRPDGPSGGNSAA